MRDLGCSSIGGLYSVPGRGEWIMYQEHIPNEEYAKLAEQFQPRHFERTGVTEFFLLAPVAALLHNSE
jgi:hypothetical protein